MMCCSDEPVGYERPEELLIRHHIGVDEEPHCAAVVRGCPEPPSRDTEPKRLSRLSCHEK